MTKPRRHKKRLLRILATLPHAFVYAFLLAPTLIVVPMSFGGGNELNFPPTEFSFSLYERLFDWKQGWLGPISRSLQVGALAMAAAVCFGVLASYGISRGKFAGVGTMRSVFLSPMFAPTIVVGLGLYLYFGQLNISGTLGSLVLAHVLLVTPFVIVGLLSALRSIDENVEIAASVMGATRLQTFLRVTLPLLLPAILSNGLLAFLLSLDEVILAWFIGSGRNPTLPVKMYSSIRWEISPVIAAVSTMLVLIAGTICITVSIFKSDSGRQDQRAGS